LPINVVTNAVATKNIAMDSVGIVDLLTRRWFQASYLNTDA
jgi:hypothetical protein